MKNLIIDAFLCILGIVLFISYLYFYNNSSSSDFSNFSDGLLLGLAIGIIIVAIIMLLINLKKYLKK